MIFFDSSFIISYKIENDTNHNTALILLDKIIQEGTQILISDYIFDEVVTVIMNKISKEAAIDIGNKLKESTKIYAIDKEIFDRSWEIFKSQKNTKLSFTDCSIIAVMEKEKIENLATFDKEFKKIKNIKIII